MKIDYTPELTLLLKFAGDTATAIRMYSKYSGETPMNGEQRRDPAMAPVDLMFLSDAISQLLNIGGAIEQGDPAHIADSCDSVRKLFESYTIDTPTFSPQAKPTFDYWAGLVNLGVAVKALNGIKNKTMLPLQEFTDFGRATQRISTQATDEHLVTESVRRLRLHGVIPLYIGAEDFDKVRSDVRRSSPLLVSAMEEVWQLLSAPMPETAKSALFAAANHGMCRW